MGGNKEQGCIIYVALQGFVKLTAECLHGVNSSRGHKGIELIFATSETMAIFGKRKFTKRVLRNYNTTHERTQILDNLLNQLYSSVLLYCFLRYVTVIGLHRWNQLKKFTITLHQLPWLTHLLFLGH